MKRAFVVFCIVFSLFCSIFLRLVSADNPVLYRVLKVVDGDTIVVNVWGNRETVRLLGIDTPESVDPRKPVQCFGKAATEKMKSFVQGKEVILVDEKDTQGDRDKYGRLLRYVYLPDTSRYPALPGKKGIFVNGEMVKQGYAFSFREYPTKMTEKFNRFEAYARENNLGLWGSCPLEIKPTASVKGSAAKKFDSYSVGDKDCGDFKTQIEAQRYFVSKGGSATNNADKLDSDRDGFVCERLP